MHNWCWRSVRLLSANIPPGRPVLTAVDEGDLHIVSTNHGCASGMLGQNALSLQKGLALCLMVAVTTQLETAVNLSAALMFT